ncbi:NmrA domain-containing protein [Mycena indigotica]|uniref:NmrA domain-containing protein n=1 Tax=Mycena indigotica TaxID=2126181 RepID=A0A8H6T2M9_9AGAR|nr:NmrA domain-containing protein [Mycena indigotica]KAF7309848.1 NmrA domain-containing protein [Mycena indigotica]
MGVRYENVIVFGPTGTVGGLVALEAHKRGANAWLAMRDTSKAIHEIPADVEKGGKFDRIQADLNDPVSVAKAINTSGAKAAYLYLIHNSPDSSYASLKAMRDAGVEYIVFLSSYSLKVEGKQLRAVSPQEPIPYAHARVEINIEDLGFPCFTVLRPAWFASNHIKQYLDTSVKPPKANVVVEGAIFDNIAPEDIGAVGGTVLVERPQPDGGKETIYLCGPELHTAKQSWELIKLTTGRADIDTSSPNPEQFVQNLASKGIPSVLAEYLLGILEEAKQGMREPEYRIGVENITKYSGKAPTSFVDYLVAHKAEWQTA